MKQQKNLVKWSAQLICILLSLVLIYGIVCYFVKSVGLNVLHAITVDSKSNEIAVSVGESSSNTCVLVFDNLYNQKYSYHFYDAGGAIHKMSYDEEGRLFVYLGRNKYYIKINPDGTYEERVLGDGLKFENFEFAWKKDGSSYRKTVNGVEYVYDYAGFWDYYGKPVNKLYAIDSTGTHIIWTSEG